MKKGHSCVFTTQFSSVQFSSSLVSDSATPWTAACQASLSITNSRSLHKLMSIELVVPSNYLILCHPLLFLPSVFPSIRVFSSESALHIGLPKYWINQVLFYEDHHKHLSAFLSPAGAYANLDNITPKVHQP